MRFMIRDVLWLTITAALVTCWYKDRTSMAATMAKAASDLAAERTADKKTLAQELDKLAFMRKNTGGENAPQLLRVINEAHKKEVARLQKRIYELEGPGYGDKVEMTEVAGKDVEWWANRAKYFEGKFREAEQQRKKNVTHHPGPEQNSNRHQCS